MKKFLFVLPVVAFLAAGCNSTGQTSLDVAAPTPTPTTITQNTNPTPTPKSSSKETFAITKVSGSKTLSVNQQGSWRVDITDQNGGGHSYSVIWGDPHRYAIDNIHVKAEGPLNAQFGHTFDTPGTYPLTFKVTNDSGQTVQSSITVIVILASPTPSPTKASTITLDAATKLAVTQAIINGYTILASNDVTKIRNYFETETQGTDQGAQIKGMSDAQLLQLAANGAATAGIPTVDLATDSTATWQAEGDTVKVAHKTYAAPNPQYPALSSLTITYQARFINGIWY